MAFAINQITIIGNIGKVEELRTIGDSVKLGFSVAVNEKFGEKEFVEWFDCGVWGKFAESMAKHMNAGDKVYVQGSLRSREVEKDGVKRKYYEIRVDELVLFPKGERTPKTESRSDDAGPMDFPKSKGRFG